MPLAEMIALLFQECSPESHNVVCRCVFLLLLLDVHISKNIFLFNISLSNSAESVLILIVCGLILFFFTIVTFGVRVPAGIFYRRWQLGRVLGEYIVGMEILQVKIVSLLMSVL